jgi:hypothetical protein
MKSTRKIQAPPVATKATDPISLGMAGGVGTALNLLVRRINNALERLSETLSKDTRTVLVAASAPTNLDEATPEFTAVVNTEIIVPHGLGRIPTSWKVKNYTLKKYYDKLGKQFGGGDVFMVNKGFTPWTAEVASFYVSPDAVIHRVSFEVELQ